MRPRSSGGEGGGGAGAGGALDRGVGASVSRFGAAGVGCGIVAAAAEWVGWVASDR